MDKELAKLIMDDLVALDRSLNSVVERVEVMEVQAERDLFKQAIYKIIGDVYCELMRPIIREYPDMDPDEK
jgi:hypothetical protein